LYNHRKKICLFPIIFIMLSYFTFAINQARIVIHPSLNLSKQSDLYLRFVFPDIVNSHFPCLWLGPRLNITKDFSCAIMAGLTLKDKENTSKISLFPVFIKNNWIVWNEFDYNFNFKNYYDFIIIRYCVASSKSIRIGIDSENLFDKEKFFYTLGPAIDFKFSKNIMFTVTYFFRWTKAKSDNFIRFYLIIS